MRAVRASETRVYEMLVTLAQEGCCTAEEAEAMVDEIEVRAVAALREARAR